jgi:hypothetical protein
MVSVSAWFGADIIVSEEAFNFRETEQGRDIVFYSLGFERFSVLKECDKDSEVLERQGFIVAQSR